MVESTDYRQYGNIVLNLYVMTLIQYLWYKYFNVMREENFTFFKQNALLFFQNEENCFFFAYFTVTRPPSSHRLRRYTSVHYITYCYSHRELEF